MLFVGDHQRFPGYCVLVTKEHVRELHELRSDAQEELFRELMQAGNAVHEAFHSWKMNYSCYGNAVPHIHWHLIPREAADPDRLKPPFALMAEFDRHATDDATARQVAERVRSSLVAPASA